MRILSLSLRVVTAVVLTTASQAYGAPANQTPLNQPTRATGRTAVIDLAHIFDNSIFVKSEVEKIRQVAETTTEKFKGIETELRSEAKQLKQYKTGSPEYTSLEAKLYQKKADAQVQAQLKQKQLQEQRSKVLFSAYEQVEQLVRLYSINNGISLVLRSNQKEPDAPQTVEQRMRRIQRPVVFEQNVDITRPILEELNRRATSVSVN